VDELLALYRERSEPIRRRLDEFSAVDPGEYFYELAYCLLTPQSSAANAARAIDALRLADATGEPIDLAALLRTADRYIRFHNTKARHLRSARMSFPSIARVLSDGLSSPQLRAWLVSNVRGLGWKEASHFLRNIGHRDLAILDRHILRNLRYHGVIRSTPKALTPKRYSAIERKFQRFASSIGVHMDELDLLFWSRETGEILK
jgi:N-glycosylase/DNA lyase